MNQRSKKKAGQGKVTAVPSNAPASPAGEMPGVAGSLGLESESRPAGLNDRWTVLTVCIFLAAMTWLVFGQTLRHEFVSFDDNLYVCENPAVTHGLNLKGVGWAFTHIVVANWHPLTMMTHMLDCRLYGLNAGGHHLTNVLLHTASVILLFLVLRRMTGALWRSALVAAVFAIHPLRVESVAWVAERKDVLSGLFFMLTLWAYVRYVGKSKAHSPKSKVFYGLVLLFFVLGLMSKPMVVTLPFVLLLLDYWPLNRFTPPPVPAVTGKGDSLKNHFLPWRLILEKIPLLALSGAACVATMMIQKDIIAPVPLALRIGNAAVSYVVYLRQMFCPAGLAVLYPYPQNSLPGWKIALAVVLLAAISAGVFLRRQRQPYLLMGWLWYLGMLIPVIGLVQVGGQAHADRYTYLPQIGLYLALIWAAGSLGAGWRHRRVVLGGLSTVILVALIFCARTQTSYWRNSESLWTHTLACTSDNDIAHYNLGDALVKMGRRDEAIAQYQKTLQITPNYAEAHNNLGSVLLQKGRVDEAIAHYQTALRITPENATAHNNLGNALRQKGRVDEAIAQCQVALQINPDYAEAHNNLAWVLATAPQVSLRNGDEAVKLAERANQLTGGKTPIILHTLAAAYAEAGRFGDAIRSVQKAIELAQAAGQKDLAERFTGELKLYEAGLPFHEKSK